MFEENEENQVTEEVTENVEETTEQTEGTEQVTEQVEEQVTEQVEEPKEEMFTKSQVDEIKKTAKKRMEAKIRKEYEKKYGRAERVVKAGLGVETFDDGVDKLESFYKEKGIDIPPEQSATLDYDMKAGAKAEADEIISSGLDEVIEEVDRLADIGADNMTPRERVYFHRLAEYRQTAERHKELAKIGVKEEVYTSKEFKDFASQFNSNTPIKDVYSIYAKTKNTAPVEQVGSLKNLNSKEEKEYYTSEEVDRLTSKDLDDPKIMEKVRKSMLSW